MCEWTTHQSLSLLVSLSARDRLTCTQFHRPCIRTDTRTRTTRGCSRSQRSGHTRSFRTHIRLRLRTNQIIYCKSRRTVVVGCERYRKWWRVDNDCGYDQRDEWIRERWRGFAGINREVGKQNWRFDWLIVWLIVYSGIHKNMRPTGATRGRINCGSTILITVNKSTNKTNYKRPQWKPALTT